MPLVRRLVVSVINSCRIDRGGREIKIVLARHHRGNLHGGGNGALNVAENGGADAVDRAGAVGIDGDLGRCPATVDRHRVVLPAGRCLAGDLQRKARRDVGFLGLGRLAGGGLRDRLFAPLDRLVQQRLIDRVQLLNIHSLGARCFRLLRDRLWSGATPTSAPKATTRTKGQGPQAPRHFNRRELYIQTRLSSFTAALPP